jgi:hypothetical protein
VPPCCCPFVYPRSRNATPCNSIRRNSISCHANPTISLTPMTLNADNEPLEPSTLAFSMYTNTSAQTVSTDWRNVEWIMQSPDSMLDHDQLFAKSLKAAGVTLYVQRTPTDPAMTGSNRKVGEG